MPPGHLSQNHQLLNQAREQELVYRELLSRPPYSNDPLLAQQVGSTHRQTCGGKVKCESLIRNVGHFAKKIYIFPCSYENSYK